MPTGVSVFEFDRAVALDGTGDGRWRGDVSDDWTVAVGVPNGGYLLSFAVAALDRRLPHPDPLAVTAHFVNRGDVGPIEVATETIRTGVTLSTGVARLIQGGRTRVHATATFGDLRRLDGPTVVTEAPPAFPAPEDCVRAEGSVAPEFAKRFDLRLTPETAQWALSRPSGTAEMAGWIRFADGREPDAASLVLFADAFPPSTMNVVDSMWVPTIELTVHVRARPSPGWLRCRFRTRFLIQGYLEEDGEIWDASGRLVALSRQMARIHA